NFDIKEVLTDKNIQRVIDKYNFTSEDDMFAAAGYQGISAALLATRLVDPLKQQQEKERNEQKTLEEVQQETREKKESYHEKPRAKDDFGVEVQGVDNLLV